MNYFPNGKEEIDLVKFIAKYQYLKISDAKNFFSTNKYYKSRIKRLIDKKILRRIKWNLVLDKFGIEYVKQCNFEYNRLNRNKKYTERLIMLSNFAAYYHNCDTVTFTPSFSIKDKECYTITGRRYIGVLKVNGYSYLTYYISEKNDNKYISSVIYDIEKERNYGNIIVFINNINRRELEDFATGKNSTIIIEDNEINRERLKHLNRVNWRKIVDNTFKEELPIASYIYCDYTDYIEKYVSTFELMDVEKMYRIKTFLDINIRHKRAIIICTKEVERLLSKYYSTADYINIDLEKHIDKKRNIYYENDQI